MARTAGVPWYDGDLMEMRARQRRWLFGLRKRMQPPKDEETFDVSGLGAVALERRWREQIDEHLSDEWRYQLDQITEGVVARVVAELHEESAHGDRDGGSFWNDLRLDVINARGRDDNVEIPPSSLTDYADLRSALEVAERLSEAADSAVGRAQP